MKRIYFDITDIVAYAQQSTRVTGIQRVQWNIIALLAERHGGELIRVSFHDWHSGTIQECSAAEALAGREFDAELLLIRFGLLKFRRLLPSRLKFRAYLRERSRNQLIRALLKAKVYCLALLFPRRLAGLGLARMRPSLADSKPVALRRLPSLDPADSFVLLGPHWHFPGVIEFAQRHKRSGGDVVVLVYDLILCKFPEFANDGVAERFNRWLHSLADCTTRFMCISRATASDLRQYLSGRDGEWTIAPVPLAHEFRNYERRRPVSAPSERIATIMRRPYVLCVGTIEIRKNGAALLRAWQRLKAEFRDRLPLLVFAGSSGWLMEDFTKALEADPTVAVIVDRPGDEELAALYQHCLFTAYPSFYEGWGLPVGEAAWFGKYCIASSTSSLPEVCGDLIDYIDPHDLDDLVAKVRRALAEPDYVRAREAAIIAAPLRLWADVAEDMLRFIGGAQEPARIAGASQHLVE